MKKLLTALLCSAAALVHADNTEKGMVSLQADASKEVSNDTLNAKLYLETTQKNAAELNSYISKTINEAMFAAKQYNQVQVKTGEQYTNPIYNNSQKITGWQGRATIIISSKNFTDASELIAKLQDNMQVESISFAISPELNQKVETELLTQVTSNFKQRADVLKAAWGAQNYQLVRLDIQRQYNQPHYPTYRAADAMMKTSSAAPQQFESGSSQIQISASGTIQLQ